MGVGKRLIILWYLHPYLTQERMTTYWLNPHALPYGQLWLGLYAYVADLYLDFSGYCDVAVGFARMTGYRMFENFNWPFLTTSLRQFWRRWHMSLSFFLRDYVYIPLGGSRAQVYRNYILTFIVCGIWHEPPARVAFWGLVQGCGLSINRMWAERWKRAGEANGRVYRTVRALRLIGSPISAVLGWFVTVNFFCLSLLIFFQGIPLAWRVFHEMVARPVAVLLGH
jgi:D-alanyl-lipoteichoic acid acyltransferase DltB (MBOAT superfamily)